MSTLSYKIYKLLHIMAQKNSVIGSQLPGGLSLIQSQFLIELDADNSRTLRDFEKIFKLDQSSISRIVAGLEENGLLRRLSDPQDARRYILQLTKEARRIIRLTDKIANAKLKLFCADLVPAEVLELKEYFELLAQGLGESSAKGRNREHPLRASQRRLARAVGLLGDSYMHSNIPVSQWHLMFLICNSRELLQIKALSERIGIAKNTASALVMQLEENGLVKKITNKNDGRSVYVQATDKGDKFFVKMEEQATELLSNALKSFSTEQGKRFYGLFRKFMIAPDKTVLSILRKGETILAESDEQRREARTFMLTQCIKTEVAPFIPETLFSKDFINIIFKTTGNIQAVFQFQQSECGDMLLSCAGWLDSVRPYLSHLILHVTRCAKIPRFKIHYQPVEVLVDDLVIPDDLVIAF